MFKGEFLLFPRPELRQRFIQGLPFFSSPLYNLDLHNTYIYLIIFVEYCLFLWSLTIVSFDAVFLKCTIIWNSVLSSSPIIFLCGTLDEMYFFFFFISPMLFLFVIIYPFLFFCKKKLLCVISYFIRSGMKMMSVSILGLITSVILSPPQLKPHLNPFYVNVSNLAHSTSIIKSLR